MKEWSDTIPEKGNGRLVSSFDIAIAQQGDIIGKKSYVQGDLTSCNRGLLILDSGFFD